MFYNLSEFLTLCKEDMGIKDIPLPVDDTRLIQRFQQSALKEFSQRSPYIKMIQITPNMIVDDSMRFFDRSVTYEIPYKEYQDSTILGVLNIEAGSYGGGTDDLYFPSLALGGADVIMETVADIQMASALSRNMQKTPTFRFIPPNKLAIFNGWNGGIYRCEIALTHDLSLSTIPPRAMTHLRQLTVLDLEEFLYNQLKRKDQLEVGVGTISLKIDEWQNAHDEKKQLLETWDNEGYNLDTDAIYYW